MSTSIDTGADLVLAELARLRKLSDEIESAGPDTRLESAAEVYYDAILRVEKALAKLKARAEGSGRSPDIRPASG